MTQRMKNRYSSLVLLSFKTYRPRITPETSPEELLDIFGEMVAPLQDYHVSIRTKDKWMGHSGYQLRDKVDEVWELVRSKYLKGNYSTQLNLLISSNFPVTIWVVMKYRK